ncbi:hypothetical protein NDU88_002344 [Pleurodeles waltl]|uniref:Uncharacterized protein n=1 Tax=Pleurodeles waltl TaxID=8319 RepID=A0AAV7W2L0_PLEWA|nr:hypothetical protein NDU88_002344 [Pleurodeles waltl]
MLSEEAKMALPAVRRKQTRMSVTGRLRPSDEVKSQHKAKRGPTRRERSGEFGEYSAERDFTAGEWLFYPSLFGHFTDTTNIGHSSGDEPPTRKESLQQQLPDRNSEGSQDMVQETLNNLSHANGEDLMLIATRDKAHGQND